MKFIKFNKSLFPLILSIFICSGNIGVAQSAPDLTNPLLSPQRAIHTFLHWQLEGHKNPEKVILPFKLATNLSEKDKRERAEQLLAVLDARGLEVDYESIPSTSSYIDPLSGQHQFILFDELSEIYLIRHENEWVFSKSSIDAIPELYQQHFSRLLLIIKEDLPEMFTNSWMGLELWQIIGIFLLLLSGLLIRKITEYVIGHHAFNFTKHTPTNWDNLLVQSLEKPVGLVVLMIFVWLTYPNLMLPVKANYYLHVSIQLSISAAIIWLLYNITDVVSDYLAELTSKTETKLDDQLVPVLRKTLKITVVLIGILLILQNNGVNVASVLAGLGIGGLAFALAAKDTLANLFGSIMIFVDRPFQIGDWIKTNDIEGTVEEVGLRSTRIRTFYNSLISVPNMRMADTYIDNLGRREFRRLSTVLNVHYETTPEQMEAFVEGIKSIILAAPHTRKDFFEVHFYGFGVHSLDVLVYCFFKVPTWSDELQQRHNLLSEIWRFAKEIGVEFAYPTQALHIDTAPGHPSRTIGKQLSDAELAAAISAFGPKGVKSRPEGTQLP